MRVGEVSLRSKNWQCEKVKIPCVRSQVRDHSACKQGKHIHNVNWVVLVTGN